MTETLSDGRGVKKYNDTRGSTYASQNKLRYLSEQRTEENYCWPRGGCHLRIIDHFMFFYLTFDILISFGLTTARA